MRHRTHVALFFLFILATTIAAVPVVLAQNYSSLLASDGFTFDHTFGPMNLHYAGINASWTQLHVKGKIVYSNYVLGIVFYDGSYAVNFKWLNNPTLTGYRYFNGTLIIDFNTSPPTLVANITDQCHDIICLPPP